MNQAVSHKKGNYTTNLLISLLMRFPEIMSIHFNLPRDIAKFTFVLKGSPGKDEFAHFNWLLEESLLVLQDLTGGMLKVKVKLQRSHDITLLIVTSNTSYLSLEGIQLICGIVCSEFSHTIVRDADALEALRDDELMHQEEIIDYLLTHSTATKQDNLLAFRDSGKVFVYDK